MVGQAEVLAFWFFSGAQTQPRGFGAGVGLGHATVPFAGVAFPHSVLFALTAAAMAAAPGALLALRFVTA